RVSSRGIGLPELRKPCREDHRKFYHKCSEEFRSAQMNRVLTGQTEFQESRWFRAPTLPISIRELRTVPIGRAVHCRPLPPPLLRSHSAQLELRVLPFR